MQARCSLCQYNLIKSIPKHSQNRRLQLQKHIHVNTATISEKAGPACEKTQLNAGAVHVFMNDGAQKNGLQLLTIRIVCW